MAKNLGAKLFAGTFIIGAVVGFVFMVRSLLGTGGFVADRQTVDSTLPQVKKRKERPLEKPDRSPKGRVSDVGDTVSSESRGRSKLQDIVQENRTIVPAEGKEGFLAVDQNNKLCTVTLGKRDGLKAGSRLAVFEGLDRIATVEVQRSFNVLSYVQPVDVPVERLSRDRYRVQIESY